MTHDFHGAKAAVFIGSQLLVYQRDQGVPWPGYWDFPGGGREEGETPTACLSREVFEEFGLTLTRDQITWGTSVPAMHNPAEKAWFFAVHLPLDTSGLIRFGDEGQRWALMSLPDVAKLPNLVPAMRDRLSLWLHESGRDPI